MVCHHLADSHHLRLQCPEYIVGSDHRTRTSLVVHLHQHSAPVSKHNKHFSMQHAKKIYAYQNSMQPMSLKN